LGGAYRFGENGGEQVFNKMTELLKQKMNEGDENSPEETLAGLKEMSMGDLERIADYANMIAKRMSEGQELSSWMYSQLTIALENLNSVHDAMDGNDGKIEPPK
jgi:phosphate uptake regulator